MSWTNAVGLGATVIGLGWAIGGYLPYPRVGLLIIAIGLIALFWPILIRMTGLDPLPPARVRQMAQLLRQAAAEERSIQRKRVAKKGAGSNEEAATWGWLYLRVCAFLDHGFAHHVRQEFESYRKAQEKKLANNFSPERATADFLEGLAKRLDADDVDPGFVMPQHFSQFDHTKWPSNLPG